MVDVNVVAMKLGELADRIARVREHYPADPEDLAWDRDALDLISFNLLLAVQTCLDLASHLIADEGWTPAATARGAFERLEEQGVISRETSLALHDAVGLRNFVAHGYSGVDPKQIHAAAKTGLADLELFATEVSVWVEQRALDAGPGGSRSDR
jgi:uncharacterized protein YutE (UPF0331/DUF86 family)